MSSRKFKFISPGIFINEIDKSQLPGLPALVGPALIGRFERGPTLKPTQVNSFEQFVQTFGEPIPGGKGGDVFRDGNYTAPTYAAYAAQAWLRNNSPVTVVRLLGDTNKDATAGGDSYAGWKTDNILPTTDGTTNGGAYGLFIAQHSALTYTLTPGTFTGEGQQVIVVQLTGSSNAAINSDASSTSATRFNTGSDGTAAAVAATFASAVNATTTGFSATVSSGVVTLTAPGTNANVVITSGSTAGIFSLTNSAGTVIPNSTAEPVTASLTPTTGTLAAIWYLDQGSIMLSGTKLDCGAASVTGSGLFLRPVENSNVYKVIITSNGTTKVEETSFDFSKSSGRFIRKRFNTNPTLTNSTITDTAKTYFLGETFEGEVNSKITLSDKSRLFGAIVPLTSPNETSFTGGDFKFTYSKINQGQGVIGKTGWFISQDISTDYVNYNPADMTKLFRLNGRLTREGVQKEVKISIKDIRKSPDPNNDYGTFTVAIRDIRDTDADPIYLEQFNNCNLNPFSDNYIGKLIGDKFEEWDYDSKLYKEYGDFQNNSDYIRVEVANDVRNASTNPTFLPFGVIGPPRFRGFYITGSGQLKDFGDNVALATAGTGTLVKSGLDYVGTLETTNTNRTIYTGSETGIVKTKFNFPELRLRVSSSEGFIIDPTDAFFGVDTTYNSNEFNYSVRDVIRAKPDAVNSHDADGNDTETSWTFSLDNIRNIKVSTSGYTGSYGTHAAYDTSARVNQFSYTSHTGSAGQTNVPINAATASYENVLDAGFDRFTTCLHGGFDGLDIKEREPFRNTFLDGAGEDTNYAYNSLALAIDSLRDTERVEFNLVAMPGVTNNSLNSKLVRMAENRGDSLAIIDLKNGYVADTEGTQSVQDRLGSVNQTVNNLNQNLRLNSSYGAAYYPWVQIRDTINGATLWAPPSIAAIGAFSYSEAVSDLWFAPAGFTRGGLSSNNAAGLPVVGVRQRLTSKERDKLYENNVNPIASFPAEGIVIFGQKTLQTTPSALDRINVRRLVIFLKREVSRIAATLLFDQNVQVTWNRFRGQVENLLGGVQAGLGLTDYRVILDETTTTPDLIDRNILYAKIFVKPARAIEFIAIDFIITDSGASFND